MQLLLILFLFLTLDLQHKQSESQATLRCHVCESENDFGCNKPTDCDESEKHCVIVVTKIFPRFFMVSKQCTKFCPVTELPPAITSKPFLLENPLPFLYVRCCEETLCNLRGPSIPPDTFREQAGRTHKRRCIHAVSVLLTVMCTAFTSLGIL